MFLVAQLSKVVDVVHKPLTASFRQMRPEVCNSPSTHNCASEPHMPLVLIVISFSVQLILHMHDQECIFIQSENLSSSL